MNKLIELGLGLLSLIHGLMQKKIGVQEQVIRDQTEAANEAIKSNRNEEKIHSMSDAALDADLAKRMYHDS